MRIVKYSPMFTALFFLVTFIHVAEGKIGIIVNKDLYPSIQNAIEIYAQDVSAIEDKSVWINAGTFTAISTKEELKDSLLYHYENDDLEGAVLVGDLPLSNFEEISYTNNGDRDIFPCDLFYMDMDGVWEPADLPNSHTGDIETEIWISRIVSSVLTQIANKTETHILTSYFDRVHKRMYGRDTQPRTYLIAGMYWEWPSLEGENKGDLGYSSSNIETYRSSVDSFYNDSICAWEWKMALIAGKEYGYVYSHAGGIPFQHRMGYTIWDIYDDATNCRFYSVYCCQNARYTGLNMCGAYTTEDNGLVSVGAAKSGSMRPGTFRHYNEPLGDGSNFGEAFTNWFNRGGLTGSTENNIAWHYGQTLQGVGTLHLQPYEPVGNQAPVEITFTGNTLSENDTSVVCAGTFTTTDPDSNQTHTFSLVSGIGDTNNVSFTIAHDTLWTKATFDFETNSTLSIRVRTTDNGSPADYYDTIIVMPLLDVNETPTGISLDNMTVPENQPGAPIGVITITDPDTGDTHTVLINDSTIIVMADTLRLNPAVSCNFELTDSIPILISVTDKGGLTYSEEFIIVVSDSNEAPTVITIDSLSVPENTAGATIGNVLVIDQDIGDTFILTASDPRFDITPGSLKLKDSVSLDYETESLIPIVIIATDAKGLSCVDTFTIIVENCNDAPTGIAVDVLSVSEKIAGAAIGNVSVTDPDTADIHTISVDDNRFEIIADVLKLRDSVSLIHDSTPTVQILITATDNGALTISKSFTVIVEKIIGITFTKDNFPVPSFSAVPNPAVMGRDREIMFTFQTTGNAQAQLTLYDAVGNEMYKTDFQPQKNSTVWDFTNVQGKPVAPGSYLAMLRLQDPSGVTTGAVKIIIGIKEEE